ncbi:MAG TPA: TolC family protein [Vicinamibacterales bacterium]|nr:TolC family protein [Vicinamibacterales bacterium]
MTRDTATLRARGRSARRFLTTTSAAAVLWLSAVSAGAQPPTAQPPAAQPAPGDQVLRITAEDAVRMAIEHNPDLAAVRYDVGISDTRVSEAQAAFLPSLQSGVRRNSELAPPTSFLVGAQGVQTNTWSGEFGLGQQLPWGGGSYSVGWSSARASTASLFSNFNPSITSTLQATVSQPLLRNFRIDPLRAQIETSERNRDIAGIGVQEQFVRTSADAERAYWSLVLANASVTVQQQSLDLARELERTNKARVDVGQSPPLDLVAARAEVAQRLENLIVARTRAHQAEDQLRTLIIDPSQADFWSIRIQPADLAPPLGTPPDVDTAVRVALGQRTDLTRARKEIDNTSTTIAVSRNAVLPDVRLEATYLTNAVGGTRLLRSGGFPGTIVGNEDTPFGDVLRQLFAADFPTWTVGFSVSYPLGRSAEEATLARARLERDQEQARLRSAEIRAVREIRESAYTLDQNSQRIETTRLARELSEQRLDAEQKRYEVGMSTNFNVIQAQRDLAIARDNELRAQLDYQLALIAFEEAQKVPAAGAQGVTVTETPQEAPPATATQSPTVATPGSTAFGTRPGGGGQ